MYYGATVASMLYVADVWCTPIWKTRRGAEVNMKLGVVKKLEGIQRRAAIQVTGVLCTTTSDLLFAHVNMSPMRLLLLTHCQRAARRLATLDECHPLHQIKCKASKLYPWRHPSPLHDILHISLKQGTVVETKDVCPRHPAWKVPFNIHIALSKEDTCKEDRKCEADIKIYLDGSGKDGKVGAAAIMYFGFRIPRMARFHLGSLKKQTVFKGECIG